ncbi:MAG: DDE-type integrase/transposase/recombinase [Rhodospirillales bacterium]|nr:DDE-type integrase/transposase/recombinase [Rhodospirillales bacterium]
MYKEIPAKEALWDRYCTEEGKRYLFVAIDRTSKFAYVELHERQTKMIAARFLRNLIAAVPYKLTHILTDNGIRFTNRKCDKHTFVHIFDRVCAENGAEHRLAKVKHPWTNGQVECMNRTIKDAAVKRYHYGSHEELKEQLHASMMAFYLVQPPDQKYIRITANIDARLKEHNAGRVPHTSKFVPWEIVTYTTFFDEQKAFEFEKYLKSHSGRASASKRFL